MKKTRTRECYYPSLAKRFGSSHGIIIPDRFPELVSFVPFGVYKVLSTGLCHCALVLIACLGLPCVLATPAIAGNYYFNVIAPNGTVIPVGPYPNYSVASDTFGSALYAHPWACHLGLGPTAVTCRNIGNGFAFPRYMPYPVPISEPDYVMLAESPYQDNNSPYKLKRGWYFLFFTSVGGSIEKCSGLREAQNLVRTVPGDEIGYYRDLRCPGAPCFSVGFDTACN